MTTAQTTGSNPRKSLRLWPGVMMAVLLLVTRVVPPLTIPDGAMIGMLGGVIGGFLVLLWWLFFSRAPWIERLGVVAVMALAVLAAYPVVHPSIANGLMGRMLPLFALPLMALGLVAAAAAGRRLPTVQRRAALATAILLSCGAMTLVRTEGITGAGAAQLHWRWTMTPEQRLLAQARDDVAAPAPAASAPLPTKPAVDEPIDAPGTTEPLPTAAVSAPKKSEKSAPAAAAFGASWAGFRGANRDSVIRGVRIETDWSTSPPVELWHRPIGPGWSSFAVAGDLAYTQEQRGGDEVVSCYRVSTGEPVWRHRDSARFYESNGGPGPRGTPTLHNGRVYTQGATGIVNALDARRGSLVWSRNAATDTGAPPPGWGFAGSPLVLDDSVVVAASGRLVAYDIATGKPRWTRATGAGGYSSPHLATIDGVTQILLPSGGGVTAVAPADGAILWQHTWEPGSSILQPAVIENGDVLISGADMMGSIGMRRLALTRGADGWTAAARWTTRGLKPYFNDFVVHEGHAYGFDGTILASIDLNDGERKWKGGRYGAGQLVLLPDQDLLLVLSEEGELALVSATPDKYSELARFKAIEGKTWNHPVIAGDVLLVRNGEEMAAFRLPLVIRNR